MNMEIRGGTDMVAISRGIDMVSILLTPARFSFTNTHPFQEIPSETAQPQFRFFSVYHSGFRKSSMETIVFRTAAILAYTVPCRHHPGIPLRAPVDAAGKQAVCSGGLPGPRDEVYKMCIDCAGDKLHHGSIAGAESSPPAAKI